MEIQAPAHPQVQGPVTSKLAIGSLVTGILSLFCSFLTGIPAVIMGIVSLKKIKASNGTWVVVAWPSPALSPALSAASSVWLPSRP